MENAGSFLARFVTMFPLYLVWTIGMILAIVSWRRSPKSSALLLAGLVVLFVSSIFGVWQDSVLPVRLARRGTLSRTSMLLGILRLVRSLVSVGAFGLVLAAVFVDRRRS